MNISLELFPPVISINCTFTGPLLCNNNNYNNNINNNREFDYVLGRERDLSTLNSDVCTCVIITVPSEVQLLFIFDKHNTVIAHLISI